MLYTSASHKAEPLCCVTFVGNKLEDSNIWDPKNIFSASRTGLFIEANLSSITQR